MKRAVLIENEKIEMQECCLPKPNGHKVRVKVISCGICGSDIPRYFFHGAHFYPLVLGHEFYGKVLEIGEKVTNFVPDDDVVGIPLKPCFACEDCKNGNYSLCKHYKFYGSSLDGAYAEEMIIDDTNLFKIDHEVANKYCALFEPSTVALHGVKKYDHYEEKNVAILGGGTIAQFAGLWARIYGAKNIVLFVINHANDDIYHQLGFSNIELSTDDDIKKSIEKYTEGKGFDLIFDCAGVNSTIINSLSLAKNKADICLIGTPPKDVSFTKKQWELINRKEVLLTGTWMSYSKEWPGEEWKLTLKALKEGQLVFSDLFFAKEFSLEDVNKAFKFIKNGKDGKEGRVLLIND